MWALWNKCSVAEVFANPFFSKLNLPFLKFLYLFLHPVIPSTRKLTLGISNRFANLFQKNEILCLCFLRLILFFKICRFVWRNKYFKWENRSTQALFFSKKTFLCWNPKLQSVLKDLCDGMSCLIAHGTWLKMLSCHYICKSFLFHE